jgi:signal transduction histidine kinase
VPPDPAVDGWRRGLALLGVAALALVLAGVVPGIARTGHPGVVTAVLAVGGALWLIELLATPRRAVVETAVVLALGWCGAALLALAPDTAGFVYAYLAASALGLRLPTRAGVAGTVAVLVGLDIGIMATSPHPVASLSTDLGIGFLFVVAAATRSARAARARTEELLAELEESRSAQAEAAKLAERARLAREVHDILAHALSGLVMSLEGGRLLAARTDADPRVTAELTRAHQLAKSGLEDTRRAIRALRGDTLPGPDLLDQLVADTAATHGLRVTFDTTGTPRPLHADGALTVYRTAQEALTNTTKHAGRAASAALRLDWLEHHVELSVTDIRGSGAAADLPTSGYGLSGLRERAELAGGSLEAVPTAEGFLVRLQMPYPDDLPAPSGSATSEQGMR